MLQTVAFVRQSATLRSQYQNQNLDFSNRLPRNVHVMNIQTCDTINPMTGSLHFMRIWAVVGILACMPLFAGCERSSPTAGQAATPPATAAAIQPEQSSLRIVSLSPAITRTLVDFQLQSKLVGRSSYCFSVDKGIPVVGDLSNINFETLTKVNPTHVLVQPPESGVSEPLLRAAKDHGWVIASWHLNTLDDIGVMIRGIPSALFQSGSADFEKAAQRAAELENAIAQAMSPGGKKLWHGDVLLVSSNKPVLAFGTGTYLSDVLTGLGCTNAVKDKGWVQLSMEDVVRLNPSGLMLTLPGYEIVDGMPAAAGQLWGADIAAINERRVGVITNWDSFLPSSAIVSSINELRELLAKWQELSPSRI